MKQSFHSSKKRIASYRSSKSNNCCFLCPCQLSRWWTVRNTAMRFFRVNWLCIVVRCRTFLKRQEFPFVEIDGILFGSHGRLSILSCACAGTESWVSFGTFKTRRIVRRHEFIWWGNIFHAHARHENFRGQDLADLKLNLDKKMKSQNSGIERILLSQCMI